MKNIIKNSFFLGAILITAACSEEPAHEGASEQGTIVQPVIAPELLAAVYAAVDERSFDKALLNRAITNGFPGALAMFGYRGDTACGVIRSYLSSDDPAVLAAAAEGAARCVDVQAFDALYAIASDNTKSQTARGAALRALGFASDENGRAQIAVLVNELLATANTEPSLAEAAVYGLMQNITYAGLSPSALPELDMQAVVDAAHRNDRLGFEAAYLLMRLQGLRAVLDYEDIEAAIEASTLPEKTYALLRVAGQFGNVASALLRQHSSITAHIEGDLSTDMFDGGETRSVAAGAVTAMAGLDDDASLTHLFKMLNENDPAMQQVALSVMARRSDADSGVAQRMWDFARGNNPWLAVTAVSGLIGFSDPNALYLAEEWLEGGSFYQAYQAVNMLATSGPGRELLQNYAVNSDDPVRTKLVMATLDPTGVEQRPARETVAFEVANAATGKKLKLETSRGDIIIEMIEGAPYAAHNFITLASQGQLDGMVWHRVIPGFVTQAGQRDTMSQFQTPTIREEWGAELHAPGTVGVATSGPDTGTAQFFINLMHNRHLDDRYTVFGRVTSGPYGALQEGDVITRAVVLP